MPVQQTSFPASKEEKLIASLSPTLNVLIMAVKKAGRRIFRDFSEIENLQASQKGAADFMLKVKDKSRTALVEYLQEVRPRYSFAVAGEAEVKGEDISNRFIINPLDGMINFAHGIPFFAITVALERDKDILAGAVYNPITDELFYAEKGSGAFLMTAQGDKRLRVSARNRMAEMLLAVNFSEQTKEQIEEYQRKLRFFIENAAGVRRFGSVALSMSYVAAGRFDGAWSRFVEPYETAAGIIIVKEAGGYVRSLSGTDKTAEVLAGKSVVATNDRLDTEITRALQK